MKKYLLTLLLFFCLTSSFEGGVRIVQLYVDHKTTTFGIIMPPYVSHVYLNDSNKTYKLTAQFSPMQSMVNVFASGNYTVVTDQGTNGANANLWKTRYGTIQPVDTTMPISLRGGGFRYPGNGDVNFSNTLNGLDALYVRLYLIGAIKLTDAQKARADVDGDGKITNGDAYEISQRVAGYSSALADTLRRTIGFTLYPYDLYKIVLAGKYGSNTTGYFPTGFDVEANGSVRIPFNESLYFGGLTSSTNTDSVCSIKKLRNGVLGVTGKLNISSIPNSKSDTILIDSANNVKKKVVPNISSKVNIINGSFSGIYVLSQAQYDAIAVKDTMILYFIK